MKTFVQIFIITAGVLLLASQNARAEFDANFNFNKPIEVVPQGQGAPFDKDIFLDGHQNNCLNGICSSIKDYHSAKIFWDTEAAALMKLYTDLIDETQLLNQLLRQWRVETALLPRKMIGQKLIDCFEEKKKELQGKKDLAALLVKECKLDQSSFSEKKNEDLLQKIKQRADNKKKYYLAMLQKFTDFSKSVKGYGHVKVDADTLATLSKTTSFLYAGMLNMTSQYLLASDSCEDPLNSKFMLFDMLNNDDLQNAPGKYPYVWVNSLKCQAADNIHYVDQVIYNSYMGTQAIVDAYLEKTVYAESIKQHLLRNLSPFVLNIYDFNKYNNDSPSRVILEKYAELLRTTIKSKSPELKNFYPRSMALYNRINDKVEAVSLCGSAVTAGLAYDDLPADQTVFHALPIVDPWATEQWLKYSCGKDLKKWTVKMTVSGQECLYWPNLLDISINPVTVADGSCLISESAAQGVGCCPQHLQLQ